MTRLCERPGCSDRAEVAYGFDADTRAVWLDVFAAAQEARSGVLCLRHADAMVVPLGWSLDDRREPVPRLFRPSTPSTPATAPPAVARRRPPRHDDTEQLQFGDVTDAGAADAAAPVSDAPAAARPAEDDQAASSTAAPWMPQFDQDDDLAGLLNARGPLLSRAFGGAAQPPSQ